MWKWLFGKPSKEDSSVSKDLVKSDYVKVFEDLLSSFWVKASPNDDTVWRSIYDSELFLIKGLIENTYHVRRNGTTIEIINGDSVHAVPELLKHVPFKQIKNRV